ncbi:MAG: nucleotidyltransferase [Lentisphaerae bacterium]|nr:MAG: nucleotidyltransferase [Lentisphaerota bacterium]
MSYTLVVLAAGMGSRFGGLKQIEPVGPRGEFILDYSIWAAYRAGCRKVVFVIRREMEELFTELISSHLPDDLSVHYAFQDLTDLPETRKMSVERTKPWGTGHAVWVTREVVCEPFVVLNADDYYGIEAFKSLAEFFSRKPSDSQQALVAYQLDQTLSAYGTVSRGVCKVSADGMLEKITEFTAIRRNEDDEIVDEVSGAVFSGKEAVSMNLWGFTPAVFGVLEEALRRFLDTGVGDPKAEFYLPAAVTEAITDGKIEVVTLRSAEEWFGMTYPDDLVLVKDKFREMTDHGLFPSPLWVHGRK